MGKGEWVSGEDFDAQFSGSASGGARGSCLVKLIGFFIAAFMVVGFMALMASGIGM